MSSTGHRPLSNNHFSPGVYSSNLWQLFRERFTTQWGGISCRFQGKVFFALLDASHGLHTSIRVMHLQLGADDITYWMAIGHTFSNHFWQGKPGKTPTMVFNHWVGGELPNMLEDFTQTRAEYYRKVCDLILINHTHNIHHNCNTHIITEIFRGSGS